jgi:hypothetical protein
MRSHATALAALLLGLTALGRAHAADFGTVELVTGLVTVQTQEGRTFAPRVGAQIPVGAEIVTGRDGEIHVETADSGFVALRPNTRLRIAEYRAEGDELDTQILSLVRGTFRSVTGWIGRHNADRYRVTTPTATIGVRGTDHEPSYLLEEDVTAIAAEAGLEPGTYDKVNEGASWIESAGGRVDVPVNFAGFAHASRARPFRMKKVPGFFKASRNERRIGERREGLKKVIEKRRAEKRAALKAKLERMKERRDKRKGQRSTRGGD